MATVTKNGKSNTCYIQFTFNGKRYKLYRFPNIKTARFFGEKIEELKNYLQVGHLPPEVILWTERLWRDDSRRYEELAEIGLVPRREKCGTLNELIEKYSTYMHNGRIPKDRTSSARLVGGHLLLRYFAGQPLNGCKAEKFALEKAGKIRVSEITPHDADLILIFMKKNLAKTTCGRQVKLIKSMFGMAVKLGWLEVNPFAHLRGSNEPNRTKDYFITEEISSRVLAACPDARWRLIFSFGRWGGLRIPSEIMYMKWADIDRKKGTVLIRVPKKTDRISQEKGDFTTREMPLFREIRHYLDEYEKEVDKTRSDLVFPDITSDGALLRKTFVQIIRKAGLEPWHKPFNNLRATRVTELLRLFPIQTVTNWLGHTPTVCLNHYAQTTEDDFRHALELPDSTHKN